VTEAPRAPAAAPEAAAWTQEKRPWRVLFLESSADALEIQATPRKRRHLAHAGAGRFAVVYDPAPGNPAAWRWPAPSGSTGAGWRPGWWWTSPP